MGNLEQTKGNKRAKQAVPLPFVPGLRINDHPVIKTTAICLDCGVEFDDSPKPSVIGYFGEVKKPKKDKS